ncbi:MAG: enoyl-CoA hydratase/isomerase family protein [Pseudonocardia sp.]|uniref:enoyl-CoA hydratase/isomerase family protein n=1 Tax=unclassified Pseudonocardia TaxID=2619320 RepID=UPI0008694477|nr:MULTISPECIES: enoyl-CoA hydratase/isomerase family protein [unclassified Pseudonocardia]MBN9107656.1 enoyl-CoA hydratase/isomerase family protein [Pseudonocardia sp.]ODU07001.1 MAG: enoyl-CoA hydratase [Pseudonocardia sp. SCN 72-51]ODV08492.1 MAG: enoyl-CoA hydratase [Pseudonocardia sp. SCN 73-27]
MSIEFDVDGAVATITINRPEARNSLDPEHNSLLAEAYQRFQADDALRCAVLTGVGNSFSAGADLKKLIPVVRETVLDDTAEPWVMGGMTMVAEAGKPMIAAVNGHALAGGLELALACDFRICVPQATFGLAEVRWAIIPGAGGTQRLPRAVPVGVATEMILTGDPIDADAALRHGLVNRIVEPDELLGETMRVAKVIASRGPVAVRAAKEAIQTGLREGLAAGLLAEQRLLAECMRTEDAAEGPRAFAEKREPVYKGR